MSYFLLSNSQRKYFGLLPISDNPDKEELNNSVTIFFKKNTIVKILDYSYGYLEYDTDIKTKNRTLLIGKSAKAKSKNLLSRSLLKLKAQVFNFRFHFKVVAYQFMITNEI
jgi:hypothetical protein